MASLRILLLSCAIAWAGAVAASLESAVQVRNAPGTTTEDTWHAIRRGLAVAGLQKRQDFTAELPLERSWSGATLLSVEASNQLPENNRTTNSEIKAGITVTCQTCYVKGLAKAELTIGDNFNASDLIEGVVDDIKNDTLAFAHDFTEYLSDYAGGVYINVQDGFDSEDFAFPTFPFDFNITVPEIKEANLRFQFDGMELYLEIETALSAGAAYEINLYATNTPVGMKVGPLMLGLVLQVDLILKVDGAIDISSGFHVKLDDGVAMDIAMFGESVSNMVFNGGQFEFLPVTIVSASASIAAILRVGVHCGIEVGKPDIPTVLDVANVSATAGVELALFANVAEFVTNITYVPDDDDCKLKVIQEYNLALGALAGASIEVDMPFIEAMTWGPVASVTTAIFTTTLAEACAIEATSKPSVEPSPTGVDKREDLETITLTTTTVTTGVSCKTTNKAMCPNNEQVSTKATITRSLVTAVPSGETPTFPETVFTNVPATKKFGSQVKSIKAMTGSPTPYVAPPDEDGSDDVHDLVDGSTGGVSNKVIIGVCVGLVLPILAAIIGAVIFFRRRKRYAAVGGPSAPMVAEPYTGHNDFKDRVEESKSSSGEVAEMRR